MPEPRQSIRRVAPRSRIDHSVPRSIPLFLKSIELAGFKSFGRPARLELPPGITALVGPNGSGKSNIVDAIRWCLGEQSTRELRGQRAEDVIHAGPKRVLGTADVELSFEALPMEGGPARPPVSIGRRLHRSGESEYLLNGDRARLRDVVRAVRDLGIDGARYVVVNQGMADALLTATPLERRALLEHAAGLSGYRAHREEACQKLATTAQNTQTIEVVLAEMEPRLRMLKRQARAIQERDEAEERLRTRLAAWYSARLSAASETWTALCSEEAAAARNRRDMEAHLRRLEDATAQRMDQERAYQQRLDTARAALFTTQRESDAARFQVRHAEESVSQHETTLGEAQERLEALRASREAELARAAESRGVLGELERERTILSGRRAEIAGALRDAESGLKHARAREAELRQARDESESALTNARHELSITRASVQELDRAIEGMRSRGEGAGDRLPGLESDIAEHAAREAAMREEVEQRLAAVDTAGAAAEAAQRRLQRIERLASSCTAELSRVTRRLASLAQTIPEPADSGPALTIAEMYVPAGWERATSAALGSWARSDAGTRLSVWSRTDLDAFLAWRKPLDALVEGVGTWGDTLVSREPGERVDPLLGTLFLERAEDLEALWETLAPLEAHTIGSPPLQLVARDGTVRSSVGQEASRPDSRTTHILQMRRERETLERRETSLQTRLTRVSAGRERQARVANELLRDARAARDAAARAEEQLRGAASQLREAKDGLWRLQVELHSREESLSQAIDQRRSLCDRAEDLCSRIVRLEAECVERRAAWEPAARLAAEAEAGVETLTGTQDDLDRQLLAARTKQDTEAEALRRLERDLPVSQGEVERQEQRVRVCQDEVARLESEVASYRLQLDDLAAVVELQAERVEAIRRDRPEEGYDPSALSLARRRAADAVGAHERLVAQRNQARTARDAVLAELAAELAVGPDDLPRPVDDPPSDDEIRRLRSRATQYAGVEVSVVAEHRELDERYRRLRAHLEDLHVAARDLDGIIATTDAEMKHRFAAAIDAVNGEFGRVFQVMLQGGSAALEQVDEEGGIGVRAQLPGRRAQSSAAFSGGERTLLASSLLFGVLKIRPTPFCVLDEVDAALDESNVDRYLAALRDIGERTQIVMITHNRATMAAADALYGVTMDEHGVSSLLSLRLEEYEAAV